MTTEDKTYSNARVSGASPTEEKEKTTLIYI